MIITDKVRSRVSGFTLIEILIALVVAGVGILAVLQLQGVFLTSASDSEKRAVATDLAEQQIESLREFDQIASGSTTGGITFFQSIDDSNTTVTVDNVPYTVATTVSSYILDSGALNNVTGTASAADSDVKQVTVNVSWPAKAGENSNVSFSTYIAAIDPNLTALAGTGGSSLAGSSPTVSHDQGTVPDVIPIDIGGGKTKETSKPLPDVDQSNESTEVSFSTVTYDTNISKLVQEDFLTVNCFCQRQAGTTLVRSPYHYDYNATTGEIEVSPGVLVSAAVSTVAGSGSFTQSEFCGRCCSGHQDSNDGFFDYDAAGVPSFKGAASHAHYKFATDPGEDLASRDLTQEPNLTEAGVNDVYLEACRFRRVDGIYQLFPDWSLLEMNVMPYDYVSSSASSALADYQEHVIDAVQDKIFGTASAAALTGRDFSAYNGEVKQLMSRGLYYDDMSYDPDWNSFIADIASAGEVASQAWLSKVPFFELNTTLLSSWDTSSSAVATVTSDVIDTIVDTASNYYGVYSRGAVTMAGSGSGSAAITAYSKSDNTGLLGNTYGNPSSYKGTDNRIAPISSGTFTIENDSLTATIAGCSGCVVVSGDIKKKGSGVDLSTVSISVTFDAAGGGYCASPVQSSKTVYTYNCYWPSGATGSVILTPITSGTGTFSPTSQNLTLSGSAITNVDFDFK